MRHDLYMTNVIYEYLSFYILHGIIIKIKYIGGSMQHIIDELLLIICSFAFLLFANDSIVSLYALLICITIVCLGIATTHRLVTNVLSIFYIGLCVLFMPFCFFLPAISYLLIMKNKMSYSFICTIPLLVHITTTDPHNTLTISLTIVISYLLYKRTYAFITTKQELIYIQDTSKEANMYLDRKNKDFLYKQDY